MKHHVILEELRILCVCVALCVCVSVYVWLWEGSQEVTQKTSTGFFFSLEWGGHSGFCVCMCMCE